MTVRTFGLSTPMPKALVAQITRTSSARKRRWTSARGRALEAGVVGGGLLAERLGERGGELLGARARARVDDRRQRVLGAQRLDQQRLLLVAGRAGDGEGDVRPVEARGHAQRARAGASRRTMSPATCGRGRRGRGHDRARAEVARGVREAEVVGTEVVPPLGDAVRLVDHEQADVDAGHALEEAAARRSARARRRAGAATPAAAALERRGVGARVLLGVDERDPVAEPARGERLDLVLHQRHQRRDDDREVVAQQRRQLVAERLARARGHHHQHVAIRERRLAGLALARPEARRSRSAR